ncbi:cell division initiation protein [Streptomyces tubbatahanensis]|uniref:Cell division initiation protein n=1 Tax=Streptomyces tubbatahanensis TaxID=2923272 RepID=A0ABY3XYA8_9ACTN|nr:cell division initiation protein [Streptomyces tubbatahanensis]UNS99233.1 cell division initiation protein [Streptomyces tubbatahanensis]
MDVQQKLDEIVATVDGARSMPMSASCVVNRAELLSLLQEVRQALPDSLAEAREVLGGREQVVADARQEAQHIIETAQAERASLVTGTEVARHAQQEADRILAEARREAEEIRVEADDYVDSKLANFEVVLSKTIGSVDRGREKLLGSGPGAEEWSDQYAQDAPERTADPRELQRRADDYVQARLGSVSAVLGKTLEAVGRGRLKLRGHEPVDELAAHMAAQDGAEGYAAHTSDSDYLAGLAHADPVAAGGPAQGGAPLPGQDPAQHMHEAQQMQQMQGAQEMQPPQPAHLPPQPQSPPPAADPYYAQQPQPSPYDGGVPHHDPYAAYAQHNAYYPQQQDPYGYGQQPDPYYAQQAQQPAYPAQAQQTHPQQAQLDETSLFDTSMIDIEQVRAYEQRHGHGG